MGTSWHYFNALMLNEAAHLFLALKCYWNLERGATRNTLSPWVLIDTNVWPAAITSHTLTRVEDAPKLTQWQPLVVRAQNGCMITAYKINK